MEITAVSVNVHDTGDMKTAQKWLVLFSSCCATLFLWSLQNKSVTTSEDGRPSHTQEISPTTEIHDTVEEERYLEEEQRKRRSLIYKQCEKYQVQATLDRISSRTLDHLLVDDTHKLIYCYVPKVACTNWKKILVFLNDKDHKYAHVEDVLPFDAHHYANMRKLSDYSYHEMKKRLKSYVKFIFVRDPMERLVSAYLNKFTKPYNSSVEFQKLYGSQIISRFRKNPTDEALRNGGDVTFKEFVQYVVDHQTLRSGPNSQNEHWRQYYHLCHPCVISYDFIGHYETLMEDALHLLKMAKLDNLVTFPAPLPDQGQTKLFMPDYYKQLSKYDVAAFWRLFAVDYLMFGYPSPNTYHEQTQQND
ncbi:carbohydrate sulfotransferase 11-like [Glandiceps talaboti]